MTSVVERQMLSGGVGWLLRGAPVSAEHWYIGDWSARARMCVGVMASMGHMRSHLSIRMQLEKFSEYCFKSLVIHVVK